MRELGSPDRGDIWGRSLCIRWSFEELYFSLLGVYLRLCVPFLDAILNGRR